MADMSLLGQLQSAALDALSLGIIVADRRAHLVYANEAARQILAAPASPLRARGGRVVCAPLAEHRNLGAAIAWACAPQARAQNEYLLAPAEACGAPDLAICVMPVGADLPGPAETNAMLVVRMIARACNLEVEARRLFGLTRTEARFASALAGGQSLAEAARTFDVSPETARTHMKSIFRKTGVGQQSQVAALLRSIELPIQPPRAWAPAALSA